MNSFAPSTNSTTGFSFPKLKPRPVVLETTVDLKAGEVIRIEHLGKGNAHCLADNPLTGPFSEHNDVIGRVAAVDIAAGTVVTGAYLVQLSRLQMESRLRNFWRRCK